MFFLPPSSPPLETAGVGWLGTVGTWSLDVDEEILEGVVVPSVSVPALAVSVGASVVVVSVCKHGARRVLVANASLNRWCTIQICEQAAGET